MYDWTRCAIASEGLTEDFVRPCCPPWHESKEVIIFDDDPVRNILLNICILAEQAWLAYNPAKRVSTISMVLQVNDPAVLTFDPLGRIRNWHIRLLRVTPHVGKLCSGKCRNLGQRPDLSMWVGVRAAHGSPLVL
jgi:hypothetical protein